ncbi:MAG: FHA domain-containing protein [Anaerolineaceae bacterium]
MKILKRADNPHQKQNILLIPEDIYPRVLGFIVVLVMLFSSPGNLLVFAQAQTPPSTILIDSLETVEFPVHQLTFRYLSPGTPLLSPLTLDQVRVHENGKEIKLGQLTAIYRGIHFAIALNPNYDLGMADDQGISRLNRAITALTQLNASLQNSPENRFSLFINPNLAYLDMLSFSALMDAINGYQENIRTMTSSLDSLDQAVTHLSSIKDNQEKALLFISPEIQSQAVERFDKIIDQARAAGVMIHVWMAANADFKASSTGQKIATAIESTGGGLFISNGSVSFPDPGSIIQGMGYSYSASYQSKVRSSGTHQLALSVKPSAMVETVSEPFEFELQVEPILPDFLNLPENLTIVKQETSAVTPDALPIEVALSFPDRHPREIVSVELWVNGKRLQVNTQPPYGSFVIDLVQFTDVTHLELEARVSDSFDLVGKSDLQIVPITWDESEIIQATRDQLWSRVLIALPIVVLLMIGLLVWPRRKNKAVGQIEVKVPAQVGQVFSVNQNFLATFSRMESNNTPSPVKPHEITHEITLIGKDPNQAQWVIEDEALEPLHAELRILPDGLARITDFNTTSGTWVNFEKVSAHGVELKQGDLVKLGNQLYRFNPHQK